MKVLDRRCMLEDLDELANSLCHSAASFQRSSRSLKKSSGFFSGFFSRLFGSSTSPQLQEINSSYMGERLDATDVNLCTAAVDIGDSDSDSDATPLPASTYQLTSQPQTSLSALVTLQLADGSWNLDESLAHQLGGKGRRELEEACPGGVVSRTWATLLALCVMEMKYSDKKEEWELVATKAEGWLKKQTLPSDLTLEQLRAGARKCI